MPEFSKFEITQHQGDTHRLHQLNMRIFKVKKSHEKAVDTLNSVFTAFLFSQIYALLFSEG